jgi:hypothetical protein
VQSASSLSQPTISGGLNPESPATVFSTTADLVMWLRGEIGVAVLAKQGYRNTVGGSASGLNL